MSMHKSHGKDKKKSSQLVIRVEKVERDAFVSLCDRLDTSAAREIRRFMRELVSAHSRDVAAAGGSEMPTVILAESVVTSDEGAADEPEKPKRKQKRVAQ